MSLQPGIQWLLIPTLLRCDNTATLYKASRPSNEIRLSADGTARMHGDTGIPPRSWTTAQHNQREPVALHRPASSLTPFTRHPGLNSLHLARSRLELDKSARLASNVPWLLFRSQLTEWTTRRSQLNLKFMGSKKWKLFNSLHACSQLFAVNDADESSNVSNASPGSFIHFLPTNGNLPHRYTAQRNTASGYRSIR